MALTAAALVVTLGAGAAVAAGRLHADVRPAWDEKRVITVLIMGSDMGLPRAGNPKRGNADGIHLLAVDTKRETATLVNIPRDSLVGGRKANAYLAMGGPRRMKAKMSEYTGIKIDYFALTSFRGLRGMVDGLGGVPVELDFPIRDAAAQARLRKGRQKLNGDQALAFTRARKTIPGGDFTRTRHQGDLLLATHRHLRESHASLPAVARAVGTFARNVETDIPRQDLLRLASLALRIQPKHVRRISLGGSNGFSGSQAIVHLRTGSAFSDIRRGRIGR